MEAFSSGQNALRMGCPGLCGLKCCKSACNLHGCAKLSCIGALLRLHPLQADEARRQVEMAEQQSAEQRFLELQQKAQQEQET